MVKDTAVAVIVSANIREIFKSFQIWSAIINAAVKGAIAPNNAIPQLFRRLLRKWSGDSSKPSENMMKMMPSSLNSRMKSPLISGDAQIYQEKSGKQEEQDRRQPGLFCGDYGEEDGRPDNGQMKQRMH